MITDEELEIARRIAAEVVQKMGEKYWPIFEMVDAECSRRADRRARLDRCLGKTVEPAQQTGRQVSQSPGARSGKASSMRRKTSSS